MCTKRSAPYRAGRSARLVVTVAPARGHCGIVKAPHLPRGLVLASAFVLAPRVSLAAAPERVVFSYSAPPECPAQADFAARVEAMGGHIVRASPGERARHFDVLVAMTATGFSGTLTVAAPGGGAHMRSVQGERCESVAQALALVTAMSLADGPHEARDAVVAAAPAPRAGARAALPAPPPAGERPADPPPTNADGDASGGLAVQASWGNDIAWTPSGVGIMAVAAGGTHLGGAASLSAVSLEDVRHPSGGQATLGTGNGLALRLGAVASWGAPWSTDETWGFVLQAGVRASRLQGTKWNLSPSGQDCDSQWSGVGFGATTTVADCRSGPARRRRGCRCRRTSVAASWCSWSRRPPSGRSSARPSS